MDHDGHRTLLISSPLLLVGLAYPYPLIGNRLTHPPNAPPIDDLHAIRIGPNDRHLPIRTNSPLRTCPEGPRAFSWRKGPIPDGHEWQVRNRVLANRTYTPALDRCGIRRLEMFWGKVREREGVQVTEGIARLCGLAYQGGLLRKRQTVRPQRAAWPPCAGYDQDSAVTVVDDPDAVTAQPEQARRIPVLSRPRPDPPQRHNPIASKVDNHDALFIRIHNDHATITQFMHPAQTIERP